MKKNNVFAYTTHSTLIKMPNAACNHCKQVVLCCVQMISTLYNNIHSEADKDNAKWGINDISRGYT